MSKRNRNNHKRGNTQPSVAEVAVESPVEESVTVDEVETVNEVAVEAPVEESVTVDEVETAVETSNGDADETQGNEDEAKSGAEKNADETQNGAVDYKVSEAEAVVLHPKLRSVFDALDRYESEIPARKGVTVDKIKEEQLRLWNTVYFVMKDEDVNQARIGIYAIMNRMAQGNPVYDGDYLFRRLADPEVSNIADSYLLPKYAIGLYNVLSIAKNESARKSLSRRVDLTKAVDGMPETMARNFLAIFAE